MNKSPPTYCVGIDGCKDGWVVVYCPISSFDKAKVKHYEKLSQLDNYFNRPSVIIIDIPIGLETNKPNRSCDTAARKFLGRRSSTIFSPPCQDAIFSRDYEEAKTINMQKTGKSISKQSWFLSNKILEAKNLIESNRDIILKEGHPECSFAQYAGAPISDNKKRIRGIFKRLDILNKLNFNLQKLVEMLPENASLKIDDLFDAAILCWTASRYINGESRTLPNSHANKKDISDSLHINF